MLSTAAQPSRIFCWKPWQNRTVERHVGVLGDISEAVAFETSPRRFSHMSDACLHASVAKNRCPVRIGYSPRALVFDCGKRLMASGQSHYLEQLDDAAAYAPY